jgi:hypothetical protein
MIEAISVFWKNDSEFGFGFTLTREWGDLDKLWEIVQEHYKLMWLDSYQRGDVAGLVSLLRDQLGALDKPFDGSDYTTVVIAVGNVWMLEDKGYMISDDWNGIQIIESV